MFVEINNAPIYVDEKGSGEPALFLHGVPDSAELWNSVVDEVSEQYQCHVTDLPGFYRSGIPENYEFTIKHYGEYVNKLVEALDIPAPFTLVAHDWGGIFAMSFACQYPEKVKRIVGGSFPFSHLYKWHPWAAVWRTPVLGELSMLAMNHALFAWELKRGGPHLTQEQINETYHDKATLWRTRWTILKLYRSANPRNFLPYQNDLERLAQKVNLDIIWGAKDKYVPTHMADLLHPHSKTVVENSGHWVPLEVPSEFSKLILNGVTSAKSRVAEASADKGKKTKQHKAGSTA